MPSLSHSLSSSPPYGSLSPEFCPQPSSHQAGQFVDGKCLDAWASSLMLPVSPPLTAQLPSLDRCMDPLSLYNDPAVKYSEYMTPEYMSPGPLPLPMDQTLSMHTFDDLCDASQSQADPYFSSTSNSISSSSLADAVTLQGVKGLTALQTAACAGHELIVNLLLDEGANIEDCTATGSTSLHLAASSGFADVVNLLLDRGANVAAQDFEGRTALHFAAQYDHSDTVMYLLHHGAYVDTIDHFGATALHLAADQGFENTVQLLTESGANVSARDTTGRNALHRAADKGHASTVKLLLDRGVDIHAKAESP